MAAHASLTFAHKSSNKLRLHTKLILPEGVEQSMCRIWQQPAEHLCGQKPHLNIWSWAEQPTAFIWPWAAWGMRNGWIIRYCKYRQTERPLCSLSLCLITLHICHVCRRRVALTTTTGVLCHIFELWSWENHDTDTKWCMSVIMTMKSCYYFQPWSRTSFPIHLHPPITKATKGSIWYDQ